MNHPKDVLYMFQQWLDYLDSHDGRLMRRKLGGRETDGDYLCTIPPGGFIFTVGNLRQLVELARSGVCRG